MKSAPRDREAFHLFTLKHDHVEAAPAESGVGEDGEERKAPKGKNVFTVASPNRIKQLEEEKNRDCISEKER